MNEDEKKFYSERLSVLWERYLQFVNFTISLTGGTVLILLVKLVELKIEKAVIVSVPALLWSALVTSTALSIYAIFWRALAQRYMEYEVLAPFNTMKEYIGSERTDNVVTNVHRFEGKERKLIKALYKAAPWVISIGLLAAWSMIGLHLATLV